MTPGDEIFALAKEIEFFPRSLIGEGVRQTLQSFKNKLPDLKIDSIPTGTSYGDWTVPMEWKIKQAWIETPDGTRIADYSKDPLHVVYYSCPVDRVISREELVSRIHSHALPYAVPYVTSYYEDSYWGFCLSQDDVDKLEPGNYQVFIDAEFVTGQLDFAELFLPGTSSKEILLSSYICHPYMANNELSGPCLLVYLASYLSSLSQRQYSYRLGWFPETIGSIAYIHERFEALRNIEFGSVLSCVGDEGPVSYLPSLSGNMLMDRIVQNLKKYSFDEIRLHTWDQRGSDERQFNWPTVNVPTSCFSKTKFHEYKEYHSNADRLGTLVTPAGLDQSFTFFKQLISCFENSCAYKSTTLGEPFLSKYGLYPGVSEFNARHSSRDVTNVLSFCDGTNLPVDIADKLSLPVTTVVEILQQVRLYGLIEAGSV